MKTKRQLRIVELEESFCMASKIADCGITHADHDAAKAWLAECGEYERLVWEEDRLLPDNCAAWCGVKARAMTALEETP